jgi:type III secretion system low calcium response chaperone LcrH/SycD
MAGDSSARKQLRSASEQIRDALEFPEEYMAPAYQHGVALYDHGRYDEAGEVFGFLAACDCTNPVLWKALGSARKMAGRYAEAVDAFGLAVKAGASDPWIPSHAAECLMHLQQYPEALAAIQHAALVAEIAGEDSIVLRRRLRALIEGVERAVPA